MFSKVIELPIDSVICRAQVRELFDEESLIGLAATFKQAGILQPLLVRRDGPDIILVEGERRLRAAKLAGLTHVPVIIDDRELSEAEIVYCQLVLNSSRQNLQPIESARAIERFMAATKETASQVAVELGMSPSLVSKLLALLNLPDSVQEKIANGKLPLTTAYAVSRAQDAVTQNDLANQAVNGGLTRDRVTKLAKSKKKSSAKRHRRIVSERIVVALGNKRSVIVAGPAITLDWLIECITGLLEGLKNAHSQGLTVTEAVKLFGTKDQIGG